MNKKIISSLAVFAISGCVSVGPDYEPPSINTPPTFVGGVSKGVSNASSSQWWRSFSDPVLNDLVRVGLSDNLDIRTAIDRVLAAEQNAQIFGVSRQLTGDVSIDGRSSSANGTIDEILDSTAGADFVFDLFGENSRLREQSLAQLEAAKFDVGTVRLAYLADIVNSYVLVRYFETAAGITRQSIESRRTTLESVNRLFDAEEATRLDVAQAESELQTAQATLPILVAQRKLNAFRIATLLDLPATTVLSKLNLSRSVPSVGGGLALGVPADLLRNRPDIRSAERSLAAATAAVGVRTAQLYPSLRLAGTITAGDDDGWSFGPSITIPLLDRTSRSANRNIALSEARQAELAYRSEVNQAVEEVQAALVFVNARRQQTQAYQRAAGTAQRVNNLTRTSYDEGFVTIDTVLDAERTELANQLQLTLARGEWAQAWVRLQVALGKGWAAEPPTTVVASKN